MGVGVWTTRYRAALAQSNPAADVRLIALAFLVGVLLITRRAELPALVLFIPALAVCLWRWRWRNYLLALVVGAAWTTLLSQQLLRQRLPVAQDNTELWLQGTIANLPETMPGRTRFIFETAAGPPKRIRVAWYDNAPDLYSGDCWRMRLKLKQPHGAMNPGGFDYETWLWRSQIGATATVREAARCRDDHAQWVNRWRQHAVQEVKNALDGHPMGGVIAALSLGERSGISDTQWRTFRRTGTSHLVAISGLHIGLVALVVLVLTRWLSPRLPGGRRVPAITVAAVCSVIAAAGYALMAGFALPTQRALIMLLVLLGALLLRLRASPSDLLAVAALAVLAADPLAVLAPGFWLSFGAVGWIIYMVRAWPGLARWQQLLALQPALVLALAPLSLYWFGEASLVAPLANLVLIPLFTLLVPTVLSVVALTLFLPVLGTPVLHVLADVMHVGWSGLQLLTQVPSAHIALAQPPLWAVFLACIGVAVLIMPRGIPGRAMGGLALLPLLLAPAPPPTLAFSLNLLDVGQGLAAVIRTHNHTLLYDTGPSFKTGFNAGEALILPYLRAQGITQLDRVVVSHGDIDHRGGMDAIRAGITVVEALGATTTRPCRAGETWHWDGVEFTFLHPDASRRWQDNNASCVLRVSGAGGRLLLTGDIESAAENALVHHPKIAAEVLVVPHHGSNTSSSRAFLAAVGAEYALVPVGWHNRWNFPKEAVLARYKHTGAKVLKTADSGMIQVDFRAGKALSPPRRWRLQQRRYWHAPAGGVH